ncbi:uncharacterized protein PV09_01892 [Verruconis gallopava]|uniref:Uncharacterized protein n=1 Tax=Verruconis gallopava TaxID=253628 RepID=A0A0D2AMQ8_9PEZI|nr:uncharacterized protein PV09_01892 [Verruconis gallopava]KIW07993.1 hypothetical protein PV09_01892 [Verruconis gallopava]
MLTFMEHHPNIECLAWPMDGFYDCCRPSEDDREVLERAALVVTNLGRTLTTLRVDCYYTSRGEPQTDEDNDFEAKKLRVRRRRFISEFAAHMTKLKVLKVEGGIPRDEKRELIAATHHSPLEKIVMIGVSCPLGNTWGVNGDDLAAIDEGHLQFHGLLEPEPEEALIENTKSDLVPATGKVPFKAEYGWPPGPSLLHSIAMHHASTLTELKFCGYNGSPVLHRPTAVTSLLLHHLRHFHKIRKVIMSFWLLTFFDFDWREPEIIDYWVNARDPSSLALQPEPEPALPPAPPTEAPSWEQMVSADVGLDADGDTSMQEASSLPVELSSTMNALAALSGDVNSGGNVTADAMMVAALSTGIVGPTQEQSNNVVPNDSDNSVPTMHPPDMENQDVTAPPVPTPETNPLDIALKQYISPPALSKGVYDILGPHLSPIAKANGVRLRASFCLGVESGDIFDLDFDVDANGVVEGSWIGPREESERDRWWGKLENRGWFA